MEILGIGPLEVLLILVIALIVMGPNDMVKTGRTIGKFLRQIVKSPTWQAVQQTSRDLRYSAQQADARSRHGGRSRPAEGHRQERKRNRSLRKHSSLQEQIGNGEIRSSSSTGKDLSAWTIHRRQLRPATPAHRAGHPAACQRPVRLDQLPSEHRSRRRQTNRAPALTTSSPRGRCLAMRNLLRSLWRIITSPFRIIFWILRRIGRAITGSWR